MRLALGLDFETEITDPVNPKKMSVTEIGAVLWDIDAKSPVHLTNINVKWVEGKPFDPRITELTGITQAQLDTFGLPPAEAFQKLCELMAREDVLAIVAHNGKDFDEIVFKHEVNRYLSPGGVVDAALKKPWIDTQKDLPYPDKVATRKLEYLAAAHGFLNPYSHRALFDVLTMLRVMSHYDFDEAFKRSQEKVFKVRALTRKPWEDQGVSNALAKERGFKFDGETKWWVKQVIESQLQAELTEAPLKVVQLEESQNG